LTDDALPPFSVRSRVAQTQIDNDCRETFRIGLYYLLSRLVEKNFVAEWGDVATELRRIGRVTPTEYDNDDVAQLLAELDWARVFDFC